MNRKDQFIVACIPACGEEATIGRVVLSSQKYVDKVLVCDDGSTDMTGQIAEKLGAIVLRNERTRGKGYSLKTLIETATKLNADITVLIDGDGQHNPDEIPNLIEPILQEKADFVLGSRFIGKTRIEAPFYRRTGLKVLNYLHKKVSKLPFSDAECGFRALSKKALDAIYFFENEGYGADAEMLSLATKNGINIAEVPVTVRYKGLKKTSHKAPLAHGFELVTNLFTLVMEEHPLLYFGVPGAILLFVGMAATMDMVLKFNFARVSDSLPVMIVAMGSVFGGLFLIVAAFLLFALRRISNRIADLRMSLKTTDSDKQAT